MEFVGHKTIALLDLWSLFHFLAGVAIGNLLFRLLPRRVNQDAVRESQYAQGYFALTTLLLLAYAWELLEYGLEQGLVGEGIAFWFQGQEHWLNRLLADPLLLLAGYLLSRRFPPVVWPARLVILIWLWRFLFVLPHSMAYP